MSTNVSKWTTALAMTVGGAMLATSALAQSGAGSLPARSSADTTKSDAPKADTTKSSAPQADTSSKSPGAPGATTGSTAGETKSDAMKSEAMKSGPSRDSAQGAGREQVKAVQQALKDKGHDPGAEGNGDCGRRDDDEAYRFGQH